MNKRILFAGIGVTGIGALLSGCSGMAGLPGGLTPDQVQQIQAATVAACGWLPVAETIVGLIPVVPATASTLADKIADEICKVATAKTTPKPVARNAQMVIMVDGQTVKGSFVPHR